MVSTPDRARPVRVGILGASDHAPATFINPARQVADIAVAAIASRDPARAQTFAAKHGIPRVHDSYEALISDPDLDAVYIVLPTSVHGAWTRAAIAGGKHVLCEKPFTANHTEAQEITDLAEASGRVVLAAMQYRYHPLTLRAEQIIASGELGQLRRLDIAMCVLLPKFSGNCFSYQFAGGATMDAGSYAVDIARTFGGSRPEVVSARAKLRREDIDRAMTAELRYAGGHTARVRCALWSAAMFRVSATVIGEQGRLRVLSPAAPHLFPRLIVRTGAGRRVERFPTRTTYAYQLDAFVAAIQRGEPVRTTPRDAAENMAVIDGIYSAAGLSLRQPAASGPPG